MRSQLLNDGAPRTWAVILEKDDEPVTALTAFARDQKLGAAHFTAIGAFRDVTLGYFDREQRDYRRIPMIGEQVEVLSLIGDVALDGGEPKVHAHVVVGIEPKVHAHVVVGKSDGTAHGGHLLAAHVWPTLEVILTESPTHLRRRTDRESGLALIVPTT